MTSIAAGQPFTAVVAGLDDVSYGFLGYGGNRNPVTGVITPVSDRIADALSQQAGFHVTSVTTTGTPTGDVGSVGSVGEFLSSSYAYQLHISGNAMIAYPDADDIARAIAALAENVSGHAPTTAVVNNIDGHSTGAIVPGAPAVGVFQTLQDAIQKLADFVNGVTTELPTIAIVLGVLLVGVVVFAVIKSNGRLARVVS